MIELFFAGVWAEVWRFGIGLGLIIVFLAAAYFSPILKKDFVYAAVVVAVLLASFTYGVRIGEQRKQVQWDASVKIAETAAAQAHAQAVRDVKHRRTGPVRLRVPADKYQRDSGH